MRQFALTALICLASLQISAAQEVTQIISPASAEASGEKASYYIGYNVGSSIAQDGISIDDIKQADFIKGLLAALKGEELGLEQEDVQVAMQALSARVSARMQQAARDNQAAAEKFLEGNKAKDGIQATESGLQYKVIKSGTGAKPTADSTVVVHYEGKLISGKVFDSSIGGEPISFPVTGVIRGWTEALMRMKVGDKWRLFIPPELAYGQQGSPPAIGPNELLIFEVELLGVK